MLTEPSLSHGVPEAEESFLDSLTNNDLPHLGVLYNATYIVTVHNHVSGNPSPTKFDSTIAAKLTQATESVRMTLRDHIILADEQYYSFKDNKKL